MRPAILLLALTPFLARAHAQSVLLFQDDFESGMGQWTSISTDPAHGSSLWHVEDATSYCGIGLAPFPSGTHAAWFGRLWAGTQWGDYCSFGSPAHIWSLNWQDGVLEQTVPLALPATTGSIRLSFRTRSMAENDQFWDRRTVWVSLDGASWSNSGSISLGNLVSTNGFREVVYDLTPFAGHAVRIAFEFWSGDWEGNTTLGWLVDDVRIEELAAPGFTFCAGDGLQYSCPCGNNGAAGHGCANSFAASGALVTAAGSPSLTADTLTLTAKDVSPAILTFFSAPTAAAYGDIGVITAFGDGVRCLQANLVRITGYPANGTVQVPGVGQAPLSTQMLVTTSGTRRAVQGLYRDAPSFCTTATFNVTNGVLLTWRP